MNNREFFMIRWEAEQPAFLRVLRAMPEGKHDYTPHEKSSTAGALAWQLALEQANLLELLDGGKIHFKMSPPPAKCADIAAAYERSTNDLRTRLKSLTDADWNAPGEFFMGGPEPVWSDTVQNLFWGYLFDMVHHRGQLSTYLRPMGGKVPAIYGPSADDSGQ
ncbi:MAG TPA: DinB family protein [Thermoanaerobaculia bacterium]|nr:DinB family protein [Thermoanaerobaculia bacterium]